MTATPHGHLAPARCSGCQTAPCTCPSVLRSGPPPCHRPRCWPHWGASVVGPLAAPRAGGVCPLDPQHRGAWLCAGGSWGPPRGCPRPLPGGCPTSRGPHPAHYARPIVLQVGSELLGRDHSGSRAQGPPPRASGSNSDRGGQVGLAGARGVLAAQLRGRPASEATARAPRLAPLPTSTSGQLGVSAFGRCTQSSHCLTHPCRSCAGADCPGRKWTSSLFRYRARHRGAPLPVLNKTPCAPHCAFSPTSLLHSANCNL